MLFPKLLLPVSQGSTILPVGTTLPYTGKLSAIPNGWAVCDGSHGTPDLRNRFLQGSDAPGNFVEAELPNLWGRFVASDDNWFIPSSYFDIFKRISPYGTQGGHESECLLEFNAHDYNAIYKDECNTVQPASYTVYYIIRIM